MDKINFHSVLEQMRELYIKKNSDYGSSFDVSCREFGLLSPIIRLSDKLNRLKTLCKTNTQLTSESIEDTLLDMANYCVMALIWQHNEGSGGL